MGAERCWTRVLLACWPCRLRFAAFSSRSAAAERDRHLRRRLLLVRRGGVRQGSRRARHHLGLYRRQRRRTRPTSGIGRRHRAFRGGRGEIRSGEGELRRSCSTRSGATSIRSIRTASSATRASPTERHLRRRARRSSSLPRRRKEEVAERFDMPRGDGGPAGAGILSGRGLPPGFLPDELRPLQILQVGLRPRAAAGGDLGQAGRLSRMPTHAWPCGNVRCRHAARKDKLNC